MLNLFLLFTDTFLLCRFFLAWLIPQLLQKSLLMPTSHFYYVYILRDVATGKRHYTGVTHDLQERLAMHNAGHVPHTSKFAPWYIETAIASLKLRPP